MTENFNGLKVTSFESRLSEEMKRLISYHGGIARVSPSMKELPVKSTNISKFIETLYQNKVDVLVLFTGVGTRMLSDYVKRECDFEKYTAALSKISIVARGPKPVSALKRINIKPKITIPEPNTWKDVLQTMDGKLKINKKTVYVQEYGISNREFIKCLEERGAKVETITVYKWGFLTI